MMLRAALAGIVIGLAYTLSPLFVVSLVGFALLLHWVRDTPEPSERRWLVALLVLAMAARIAVAAALFLSTNHETTPFGRLFGDEEYFIRRGIWLSNIALGIPISIADVKYAFDELIHTSFVWMLAALNVLFGPAQYGVRLAGVGAPIGASTPAFTLSVEPWAGLRFDTVRAMLRGIVDLTGTDRVGGPRGPSFGLFAGVGVEI